MPVAIYIQENQLNYPQEGFIWSNGAIVQVTSAYIADRVLFNGPYLKDDFLRSLKVFLDERGDYTDDILERVAAKCGILLRGINLKDRFGDPVLDPPPPKKPVTFLWNHRWAYEKGIDDFAIALRQLHAEQIPFQVILAGHPWDRAELVENLLQELGERVILSGLLEGQNYGDALRKADVMVACSKNEPLGVSMIEAIYMGCLPLLPARGSFPTLLPSEHHDLLYDGSVEQLIDRMRMLALNPAARPGLAAIAAAYDWSNVTRQYDQTFDNLTENMRLRSQLR